MIRFAFLSILRFFVGTLLVQGVTVILVVAAMRTHLEETWIIFVLLGLTTGFLAALLFASIASHTQKDALSKLKEHFSEQREKIRLQAEKEKTKVIEKSHRQIIKQTSRARTKADFKTRAAFVGLAGFGALMLFTQFATMGLLALSTAGGALAGYVFRARRDSLAHKQEQDQQVVSHIGPAKRLGIKSADPAVKSIPGKSS
jgi:mannitol-specific phosphotransferase system IIBC component